MLEEGVWVRCLRRLLISSVKGKMERVVMVFLERTREEPDRLSDCDPETWTNVCAVLDVSVVLVSPSSVVTGFLGDVSLESDLELLEPQSCSISKKRAFWTVSQEEMRYQRSPVKMPPPSRRRMLPSTPQQSSRSSIEERQWQMEV